MGYSGPDSHPASDGGRGRECVSRNHYHPHPELVQMLYERARILTGRIRQSHQADHLQLALRRTLSDPQNSSSSGSRPGDDGLKLPQIHIGQPRDHLRGPFDHSQRTGRRINHCLRSLGGGFERDEAQNRPQ